MLETEERGADCGVSSLQYSMGDNSKKEASFTRRSTSQPHLISGNKNASKISQPCMELLVDHWHLLNKAHTSLSIQSKFILKV